MLLVSDALRTLLNLLLEHALLIKDVTLSQLLKGILVLFFLVILIFVIHCEYLFVRNLLFFIVAQFGRWFVLPVNDFFVAAFSFDNALIQHVNLRTSYVLATLDTLATFI